MYEELFRLFRDGTLECLYFSCLTSTPTYIISHTYIHSYVYIGTNLFGLCFAHKRASSASRESVELSVSANYFHTHKQCFEGKEERITKKREIVGMK